jgi:hypothetical protein
MHKINRNRPGTAISASEWHAIQVHKYFLSQEVGYDVGEDHAIEDWLVHHAAAWRRARLHRDMTEQKREIEKHKWIESERAGYDLGQQAVNDWINRFASLWRQWRESIPSVEIPDPDTAE